MPRFSIMIRLVFLTFTLGLCAAQLAHSEVVFDHSRAFGLAESSAGLFEIDVVRDTCSQPMPPEFVEESSSRSLGHTLNCSSSQSGSTGSATSTFSLGVTEAEGRVTQVVLSGDASGNATAGPAPNPEEAINRGTAFSNASPNVVIEVLAPVLAIFSTSVNSTGVSSALAMLFGGSINFQHSEGRVPGGELQQLNTFPPGAVVIEPGTYFLSVEVSGGAEVTTPPGNSDFPNHSSSASFTVSFESLDNDPCAAKGAEEGECTCEREWSAGSGAFDEASNWLPEFVPEDDGNGCNDITLSTPGEYEVTFGSGATADSLSVLAGSPMLSGGGLSLGGFDNTALSVSGVGALTLNSGSIQADSALVSGSDATFALRSGASLTVTTSLETGQDIGDSGVLNLDAETDTVNLSVAGNATLGGSGSSIVTGAGALTFDVLADLSMAVFPGSASQMILVEPLDESQGTVALNVIEKFTIGGGGAAAANLEGAVSGTVGSMTLGALEGGTGSLSLTETASLTVSGEARIGDEGTGTVTVNTGGSLAADTLLVSGPKPENGKGAVPTSSLSVTNGGSLSVTTLLETGRDVDDAGNLEFGGGEEATTVSVVGDAVLAGAGSSLVTGLPALSLDVLGDLSMAVFPGSESQMILGQSGTESTEEVTLNVAQAFNVGGGGAAVVTLDGLVTANVGSLNLGLVEGGTGIVNLVNVAELIVTEEALVGGAGLGTLNIKDGSDFFAEDLTVDGLSGEELPLLHLASEDSVASSRANVGFTLIVGDEKLGEWTMVGNTELNAEIIALGSKDGSIGTATLAGSTDGEIENVLPTRVSATQFLLVGQRGSGSFETSGAAFNNFGSLFIASNATSTGSFIAEGVLNFTTIKDDLVVGESGTALLELRTGGVTAGACIVGAENGGFGSIRVFEAGGLRIEPQANPEGETEGEPEGEGKSNLSFPGFLEIGRKSNGIIELFDPLTRLVCSEAIIGGDNASAGGTLGVDTGATFECNGSVTLGASAGPALVRVADGATMTVAVGIIIGPKGLFIAGGGSNINSGSVLVNGRLRVVNGLSIERPPGARKALSIQKGEDSPTVIDGDLLLGPDGVLEVTAGAGEALIVTGAATLDGTLEITLQPGATFTEDQLLDLVNFQGGVTGSFATVTFLNAPDGFEGDVEFADGKLRLRVVTGGTVDPEGEGEGHTDAIHSADQDSDERISLSELLRVIQFYNALGLHCVTIEGESEDGYIAGADDTAEQCSPHDSDFNPQDWTINLSELLQLIQLYNADGYEACEAPEGFCPVVG